MNLDDFDYPFDEKLIALYPLKKRDHARLLVVNRQNNVIIHDYFYNLKNYLPAKSLIVLNNSKVVHARLLGKKTSTGGKVEIFLLKKVDDYSYHALLSPLWKIPDNEKIVFEKTDVYAQIVDKENRIVRFNKKNIDKLLPKIGHVPLPPYIKRPDSKEDAVYYQTVYAKKEGSVAAPTAGRHFTKPILSALKKQGHKIEELTLHINYGTFRPVEAKDIRDHQMHFETYEMNSKTRASIEKAKKDKRPIVSVGTTSTRVLETLARNRQLAGETNLFIYPGFEFRMVDILVTNFHLPKSTLFILTCAFGGTDLIKKAYEQAVQKKYRFYSYGDAMLIV